MSEIFGDSLPFRHRRATKLGRGLELVGLALLMLTFIWVAVSRIWPLRIEAEKLDLLHTRAAIQVAVGALAAQGALHHQFDKIVAIDGANPMTLLDSVPSNYVGELSAEQGEKVEGYHWYFDTTNHQLVYVVGNPDHFTTALPGRARAVFRLSAEYDDRNHNGRYDPESEPLTGIRFAPVAPYEWDGR